MKKIKWSMLYIVIILFITYLPLFLVVLFSFNESKLTVEFTSFSLKWYKQLFSNGELREALINSLILGGVSVLVSAVIGTLGAIGLVIFEYLTNVPIMVPEIILGMVFMAFFSLIKLPFGMVTLVIAHTSFCIPYILMTVRARLVSIDKSLEEAAYDLGASQKRIFFDITVPLIMPAIISGCILAFAMSFDDVVISIFVNSPKSNTLPIKIYTQLKTGVTPEINALCTVILIVVIFILVFGEILVTKKDKQNLI